MSEAIGEKPFFQKTKVLYVLAIVVLLVGTLLTLTLTGHVDVTSQQIFGFAEWIGGFLLGTHGLQRAAGYIAQAIGGHAAEPVVAKKEEEGE